MSTDKVRMTMGRAKGDENSFKNSEIVAERISIRMLNNSENCKLNRSGAAAAGDSGEGSENCRDSVHANGRKSKITGRRSMLQARFQASREASAGWR